MERDEEGLKVGDVFEVPYLDNGIAVVVALSDTNGLCCNWIVCKHGRWRYNHVDPPCDIWLSSVTQDYKKITSIKMED